MEISKKGLEFIEDFEGFYPTAYKCQAGIWTLGIGTTIKPNRELIKQGDTCTREQALIWLQFEILDKCKFFDKVLNDLNLELKQNEYDALVSFFYNLGIGKCYVGTTMGNAIHSKDKFFISEAFLVYNKYTWHGIKRVSKGLDRRRRAERDLFLGV